MTAIEVRRATEGELESIALLRLRWAAESRAHTLPETDRFVTSAAAWAWAHRDTHIPFVAVVDDDEEEVVGFAWLAIVARVPSPFAFDRRSGDLQSCYVIPERRGAGIGGQLVDAILEEARSRGIEHVTVHASAASIPMYERTGFRANPRLLFVEGAIPER